MKTIKLTENGVENEYALLQLDPATHAYICKITSISESEKLEIKHKFEVWRPKENDLVWFNNYRGETEEISYREYFGVPYLVYENKKDAYDAHEKSLFNYEVEMFIKEKNEGWAPDYTNRDQRKNFIILNIDGDLDIEVSWRVKMVSDEKVFKTTEIGKEIIAKFDNDKLLKWWI